MDGCRCQFNSEYPTPEECKCFYESALYSAAILKQDISLVAELLCDATTTPRYVINEVFCAACVNKDLEIIKVFCAFIDVRTLRYKNDFPVRLAAAANCWGIVQYLCETQNVDIHVGYDLLLLVACQANNFKMVQYFVEKGLDVNSPNCLGFALINGYYDIAYYLFEQGARSNELTVTAASVLTWLLNERKED